MRDKQGRECGVKFKLRIDQDPEVFDRVSPGNVLVREIIWCVTRVQT